MADLEIRPAGKDDVEAMWRLARQPPVIAGTLQIPSLRLDQREQRFADLGDNDHFYVAVRHGEVVGFADLHVHDRRRRHAGDLGVMVSPAHSGQGIGTALLQTLIELADKWLDVRRLELTVYADNDRAIRLYERNGFQVEGRLREYAFTDGAYVDALYMARLRPDATKASDDSVAATTKASDESVAATTRASDDSVAQAGMGSSESAP